MRIRKGITLVAADILAGIAVSEPTTQAVAGLMTNQSSQRFCVNEQCIHLTLPEDKIGSPFWPWREEVVPEVLRSCPGGDYYLEIWDVFKNGKFLRTEYNLR